MTPHEQFQNDPRILEIKDTLERMYATATPKLIITTRGVKPIYDSEFLAVEKELMRRIRNIIQWDYPMLSYRQKLIG